MENAQEVRAINVTPSIVKPPNLEPIHTTLKELQTELNAILEVFQKNPSLFERWSVSWSGAPWWKKFLGGIGIVMIVLPVASVVNVGAAAGVGLIALFTYSSTLWLLKDHYDKSKHTHDALKNSLKHLVHIVGTVLIELENQTEKLKQQNVQFKSHLKKLEETEKNLTQSVKSLGTLQEDFQTYTQNLSVILGDKEKLKRFGEQLETFISQGKSLFDTTDKLKDTQGKLKTVQEQLSTTQQQLDKTHQALDAKTQNLDKISQDLQDNNRRCLDLVQENQKLTSDLKDLHSRYGELWNRTEAHATRLSQTADQLERVASPTKISETALGLFVDKEAHKEKETATPVVPLTVIVR
jgi:DNA repair exonuclease SbcCD ATPase subunit